MPNKLERFTEPARRVLSLAQEEAERFHHHAIGTEHLLIGLAREGEGIAHHILDDFKLDYWELSSTVSELSQMRERQPEQALDLSDETKRVLERAIKESRRQGHASVGTEHLLFGLVENPDAVMTAILARLNVSADDIRQQLSAIFQRDAQNMRQVRMPGFTRLMPGSLPFTSASVEALKVLQLIEDGKVTAEQGESLLRALPPTGFPTPQGWMQIAKRERENETRNLRVVISDKRTNNVFVDFKLPVQKVQDGLHNLLGAIEGGTARYLQYLDSGDEAYRIDIYMDEPDQQSGAEAS